MNILMIDDEMIAIIVGSLIVFCIIATYGNDHGELELTSLYLDTISFANWQLILAIISFLIASILFCMYKSVSCKLHYTQVQLDLVKDMMKQIIEAGKLENIKAEITVIHEKNVSE